ncbi:phosphatidylinositol 4-phosphate 5-kinase-like protein 1 isoform X1 [Cricetulus griseus]|uniref:Phosphatidylinositol 4-phosphate 5-kinase-like protein 1 n=2 Tax=Cricetulus griseus TaxID=10029 RepID=A0A9J7G9D8_CRIGR|nr:phosphatidylinositol 4-phosphate 5-kinase-like protein 1 isoform X1 [Cricetulus griseus]XP_027279603.1 phosphatidylinositol 4-phosphate 5-kinase-like protein 1 isoform X1 [Cricetulus griseus]
MATKTGRTRFRLPASRASTRKARPWFRRKLRRKLSLRHPNQYPAAPPGQDQGPEDAAAAEVGPAGKHQRPPRRSGATEARKPILRHSRQRSAAPPGQDQGPQDAAAAEVGPVRKGPRSPRGLGTTRTGSSRLASRSAEVGPDSCIGASGTQPKPEKLQLGAMAAPSPGPREIPAPSLEVGSRAVVPGDRRGLLWRGLRDKHNRVGLFEINPGHELHRMTRMMQEGLWAATEVFKENPPKGPPTQKDFSEVMTQVHEEGFELCTLAGPAFARLRRYLGLTEEDYQATLGPRGPYLQFLSTSKSKASFFLSHDQRFFLKTQRRHEVQVLLAHLPRYVQHLLRHPHTLLARLLGVHSLRVAQGKKKYFIIMQSVFYPVSRISERYDIKACEQSRWVEPVPEGSPLLLVLKDLNFEGKTIRLGSQRSWFLRQLELDTTFLRDLNVLDYSLLVAFQLLHEDEKDRFSIFRTFRSVHGAPNTWGTEGQNRRLLPDVPNALHILDGPDQRYFLGLVDLTTVYGFRKRLEHLWKMMRYPGQSFSTVSPAQYARRLRQWVETHTQ